MKRTEHTFTRAGAVYDCVAKADSFAGVSGIRKRPVVTGRTWWATVFGGEYATVRWSGQEFDTMPQRSVFEDAVVAMVHKQTPLHGDPVEQTRDTHATARKAPRTTTILTICPLCRDEDGVIAAPLRPRVTEMRCRRCGDFHIDVAWMTWADSTLLDTAEAREAFSRQSCEANACGLLLQLTEDARGLPQNMRPRPPRRLRDV